MAPTSPSSSTRLPISAPRSQLISSGSSKMSPFPPVDSDTTTVPQPRSPISPHQPSDTRTLHCYTRNRQISRFLQTSRTATRSVRHSTYPESRPTLKHHSWRRTISYWGATARTFRALVGIIRPHPLGPIINPVVPVFMMDQHSIVGLVEQGRPFLLVGLLDLVKVEQNARVGREEWG